MSNLRESSVALEDPHDEEQTQLTGLAAGAVRQALVGGGLRSYPVEYVRLRSGELIILEARGQSSATGHGKQGVRPDRLAFLRDLNERVPVLLVFFEGSTSRREAWMSELGPASPVSHGQDGAPDSKRYGWSVREMRRREGAFVLPERVPAMNTQAQGALV